MDEFPKFIIYEIEESGEKKKLDFQQEYLEDYLHPEKVFIIVRGDLKRIYLWKGVRSPVRKRFIGSKLSGEVQSELKKNGFPHCKIVAVDQGDELQEFLNVFSLKAIEVTKKLEDMRYFTNLEREKMDQAKLFAKKEEILKLSKLDEIKEYLDEFEKILWIKNSTLELKKNWLKSLLKNKKYKDRIKNTTNKDEIEPKKYEIRYVITNKKIFLNSILNKLYDFSSISENIFKLEGEIATLDLVGLRSFEIEKSNGTYDIWFNAEPIDQGDGVFLFDNLSLEEYEKLIEVLTIMAPFRAEIPKSLKLKYIRKKI